MYNIDRLKHGLRGLPAVSHGELRSNDLPTFRFNLLDGLLFLVVDDTLFLEIFDLSVQLTNANHAANFVHLLPSYVRNSSRMPGLPVHMLWMRPLCPSWCLRCLGCCCDRDTRKRHHATRSTFAVSFSLAPQMRRRQSSWGLNRPRKMRTSPLYRAI